MPKRALKLLKTMPLNVKAFGSDRQETIRMCRISVPITDLKG
jgi:hypothetical protein